VARPSIVGLRSSFQPSRPSSLEPDLHLTYDTSPVQNHDHDHGNLIYLGVAFLYYHRRKLDWDFMFIPFTIRRRSSVYYLPVCS
jgi:hypothetical protein